MKKFLSVVLAVCLCLTAFSSMMLVSADAAIVEKTVDLTKSVRIGTDADKGKIAASYTDDGMVVDVENYNANFVNGTSEDKLWLKGVIMALKYNDDSFVFLENGREYIINVTYDVNRNNGTDFFPAIGVVYNDNTSVGNAGSADNGSYVIAAQQHTKVGSYAISATKVVGKNRPIRLAFYGVGQFTVKSVTVSTVGSPKEMDLSKSSSIIAAEKSHYDSFAPATDSTPFTLTAKSNAQWVPFHTDVNLASLKVGASNWLKMLFSLKKSDDTYYKMQAGHKYQVTVEYAATSITAGVTDKDNGCRPAVAIVYNNNPSPTSDNGAGILAADVYKETVGTHKIFTTTCFDGKDDRPLRLAIGGRGCTIEVYSVKIVDIPPMPVVTYIEDGISTAEYSAVGTALKTPAAKEGYIFRGWFDADSNKVETVEGDITVTAKWVASSKIDLTQSTRICYDDPDKEKADVTISYTEESDSMNVAFSEYSKNYEVIKADGSVNTGTLWAKGGIVALKNQDGSYVKFQSGKKYVINVAYDITKISTQDPYYAPQIGLCYNDSTGNDSNDNGQKIIAANRNTKCGSYVLSAVVKDNSLANKPLRLIFDGVGKCVIKNVSVVSAEDSSDTFYAVKYVDEFNALPDAQMIEKGTELPKYVQNAGFNFGGWFNGDEKVTTAAADGTLTAKWFTRTDINMDDSTNILDLVNIKKRLADNEDNVLLDVDRNGNVNASDIAVIRKQLFGKSIFTLNGNNIDDYSVYTSNSSLVLHKAAQELTYAVKGACGITLPIVNENTDKEIAIIVDEAIGLDNYSVELDGAKLVITAGSDYAASNAVQKVSEYIHAYGIITADIEFIGQYDNNYSMVGNYKYVWGDEFNGNALDTAKWTVVTEEKNGPYYLPTDQYYLASVASLNDSDPDNDFGGPWKSVRVGGKTYMQEGTVRMIDQAGDNYFVQDGVLTMKTQKSSDGYTGTKISANKQFRYGIMEAKIKLCTSNGAASTFWARGVDDKDKETSVVNEFDFAENFGTDTVKPNLHTWLKHGAEHINHGEDIEKRDSITLNDNDYHYIAMEWTANVVRFFFDGELYLEQNIEDQETWNAFRLSTYLILGISAPTDMYANYGGATPGQFLMDNIGSFCESQSIDYVRVYQLGNSDNTLSAR